MNTPDGSPTVLPVLLQNITEAICDRPAESAAQYASRRREIEDMANGLQPKNAVEMMLVSMVIAHAHLLEDATCEAFRGRDDRATARTKSQIVALGRGILGFLKELRTLQDRRRKAEAAAKPAVKPVAAPVPDGSSDYATSGLATPMARGAAAHAPIGVTPPELPAGLLPPLRRADTSFTAAMAVSLPPKPRYAVSAGGDRRAGIGAGLGKAA